MDIYVTDYWSYVIYDWSDNIFMVKLRIYLIYRRYLCVNIFDLNIFY